MFFFSLEERYVHPRTGGKQSRAEALPSVWWLLLEGPSDPRQPLNHHLWNAGLAVPSETAP